MAAAEHNNNNHNEEPADQGRGCDEGCVGPVVLLLLLLPLERRCIFVVPFFSGRLSGLRGRGTTPVCFLFHLCSPCITTVHCMGR